MNEATSDSVKVIVRNVLNGVRTMNELRRCGCGNCREALVILENSGELAEKELEDAHECQCCGKRPGKRVGPPCSKRYLCQPCMVDPSPIFEGCKHGEED